jgi:hypothetical protein
MWLESAQRGYTVKASLASITFSILASVSAILWLPECCHGEAAINYGQLHGGKNPLLSSYLVLLQSFSRMDAQFSIDMEQVALVALQFYLSLTGYIYHQLLKY